VNKKTDFDHKINNITIYKHLEHIQGRFLFLLICITKSIILQKVSLYLTHFLVHLI